MNDHPITQLPEHLLIARTDLTLVQVAGPVRTIIERTVATLSFITEADLDEETDAALTALAVGLQQALALLKTCEREYECPQ
jgi:hypothetical protein